MQLNPFNWKDGKTIAMLGEMNIWVAHNGKNFEVIVTFLFTCLHLFWIFCFSFGFFLRAKRRANPIDGLS